MFRVEVDSFSPKYEVGLTLTHQFQLTSRGNFDGTGCEDGLHVDNNIFYTVVWLAKSEG